jgi:hypothetical protein
MSDAKTKRLELIYQDAATNLRFLKQQEWVITTTQMTFRLPLMIAVILIVIFDAVVLHEFIGSMQRFRDRIDWIHKYAYPPEEQNLLRLGESDSPLNTSVYIHILILISVAGAALSAWAIFNTNPAGT